MSEEEKQESSDKRYNSILEIIDKHLVPDEQAKKDRGEVFTPPSLVREMLFGLRKSSLEKGKTEIWGINENGDFFDDKESDRVGGIPLDVWRDPKSTFLDPANGIGNFPIIAYYMLDYQIGEHGPSEFKGDKKKDKRRKHIIEKMLYMIELEKGNCATSRSIFKKIDPNATPNICCSNSLNMTDEKLKSKFGVNRFDVIMGNPPYQTPGASGDNKLYLEFIKYANEKINNNGFIIYVTPSSLLDYIKMKKKSEIFKQKYNFIFLNDTGAYLKGEHFPSVGSTFVYFIYQNNEKYKETYTLKYNNKKLELIKLNIYEDDILSKLDKEIFSKIFDENINYSFKDFLFNQGKKNKTRRIRQEFINKNIIKEKSNSYFKYKIIDTINISNPFPGIYYYYNEKDNDYNKNKIVFSKKGYLMPTIDTTHEYTYSDNFKYLLCDNNCKEYKLFFNSSLINYLVKKIKKSGFFDEIFFNKLSKLKLLNFDKINNEDDIFKELNIEKYKDYIKSFNNKKEPKPESGGTRTQKPKRKTRKHKKPFFGLF